MDLEDYVAARRPLTDIASIVKELKSMEEVKQLVAVTLTSGSFSPVHYGHLEMHQRVWEMLEANGVHSVGGYLSPATNAWVQWKHEQRGTDRGCVGFLDRDTRVQFIQWSTEAKEPRLYVDKWEAFRKGADDESPLPLAVAGGQLQRFLQFELSQQGIMHVPKVIVVMGSDMLGSSHAVQWMAKKCHQQEVGLAVVARDDGKEWRGRNALPQEKEKQKEMWLFVCDEQGQSESSSSGISRALALQGKVPDGWVEPRVAAWLEERYGRVKRRK